MRSGLVKEIYETMTRRIIVGELAQSEVLTEISLAAQFNSSRTPVREACIHLVKEGFLKAVPGRGYIVTEISLDDLCEIYQLRLILEPAAAELAARAHLPKDFFSPVVKLAEKFEKDWTKRTYEEFQEYRKSEYSLHSEIARACKNTRLARMLAELMNQFRRFQFTVFEKSPWMGATGREHSAIIEAIQSHDAAKARQLMYEHIQQGAQRHFQLVLNSSMGQDLKLVGATSLGLSSSLGGDGRAGTSAEVIGGHEGSGR